MTETASFVKNLLLVLQLAHH